jgi:hypothetical protein
MEAFWREEVHHGEVAIVPEADWWDASRVAALPAYLSEPPTLDLSGTPDRPHVERREPPATWAWLATTPTPAAIYPASLIISRRIGLPPAATVEAVTRWWRDHERFPVLAVGADWLELGTPDGNGGIGCMCRLPGRLHLKWAWPPVAMEVDLAPWSASETEVDLRPEGTIRGEHRRRRFFAAGHCLADRLAEEMLTTAG